jgi:hypothetical protein
VTLSVKSLVIAAALLKALCFLFVSLLNLVLPPYGGAFLALLTSVYLGYDPTAGPISVLVGTLYSLIAGAVAGALFGWLYNSLVEKGGQSLA